MNDPIDCTSPPANNPMSVELARALAEAADGLAVDERPFYVVARYEPITDTFAGGFVVWGPYGSFDEVGGEPRREVCDTRTAGFFGPFQATPASATGQVVDQVDLHIRDWPAVFTYPTRPDALFFTPSGVEKFALPYYGRIFGPEFAAQVRDQFAGANVQVMAHYPWSEYSDGTRVPEIPVLVDRSNSGTALMGLTPTPEGTAVLQPVVKVGESR